MTDQAPTSSPALQDLSDVVDSHVGRSRAVLEYGLTLKRVLDGASDTDFGVQSWAPLAEFVDTACFDRVGNFKDLMDWDEYVAFLTRWAPGATWECSFKRVTETSGLVFLELEERTVTDGVASAANSLSVYAFDPDDRIVHIDVYLQMPLPRAFLPAIYQDVRLSD